MTERDKQTAKHTKTDKKNKIKKNRQTDSGRKTETEREAVESSSRKRGRPALYFLCNEAIRHALSTAKTAPATPTLGFSDPSQHKALYRHLR